MNKFHYLLIIILSLFATNLYAEINVHEAFLNDGFCRWWWKESQVTTELIECCLTSNVYTKIDIHREYGVPRYGIVTDCSSKIIDTVWYIPNNFIRSESGINTPKVTDTSIIIWWGKNQFTFKIMNILTGEVILNETHMGQSSNLFSNGFLEMPLRETADTNSTIVTTISFDEPFFPRKYNNIGTTINYNGLSDGLYWIYIVNENNEIVWMITIRKEII